MQLVQCILLGSIPEQAHSLSAALLIIENQATWLRSACKSLQGMLRNVSHVCWHTGCVLCRAQSDSIAGYTATLCW